MRYFIIIVCIPLIFSCRSNKKQERREMSINRVVRKDTLLVSKQDVTALPLKEIDSILNHKSNIGDILIHKQAPVFLISSNGGLTKSILGYSNRTDILQRRYNNMFKVDSLYLDNEFYEEKQLVEKLIYKKSVIKTYYNKTLSSNDIVSAIIRDKEINLAFNIRIGDSRDEVFRKLFKEIDEFDFSLVNQFTNSDYLGEKEQSFVFERDSLKEVVVKSVYSWVSSDLD